MTIYYTPDTQWNHLQDFAWNELNTWYNACGYFTIGGDLEYTTTAQDLGSIRRVVPETQVISRNVLSGSRQIVTYLVSNDGQDYTEVQPGPLLARYIKTRVSIQLKSGAEGIDNVVSTFLSDTKTLRFDSIDTSELDAADADTQLIADGLGITQARTLRLSDTFSHITGVSIESDISETRTLAVVVVDSAAGNFTFGLRDLDTWGQVGVDGVINITITGLPLIESSITGGWVRPRY